MDEELKPESEADAKPSGMSFLRSNGMIIGLVFISLFLNLVPGLRLVLLPFEYFTTFIHEGSHTIASLIMGAEVHRIVINPDTSGYMQHTLTGGMFSQGFIGSAGYIGAALFGGALIVLSAYEKLSKVLLALIGMVFLVAIVMYVRDLYLSGVRIFVGLAFADCVERRWISEFFRDQFSCSAMFAQFFRRRDDTDEIIHGRA